MWVIAKHESLQLLKSVKSILVLLFLLGCAYAGVSVTELLKSSFDMMNGNDLSVSASEAMIHSIGLSFAIFIFGPLFAFILTHDAMNRDIEQRTMRFLITKTERKKIVLGKVIGHLLFWFTILTLSYLLIFILSGYFSFFAFFQSFSFISVFVGLALLLSLIIKRPIFSSFISILLGIALPILSLWAMISEKWVFSIFKYVSPYNYLKDDNMLFLVNFAFTAVYIGLAIYLFRKKDV
ncbi:ABC transporter permease [Sporosarcina sp. BI001-red]|uniref:ABC transporter permease n=1 Tax=Sporosarcina sp. BI001-red TaxID=2282866 RepID=UPI001314C7EE|nr:ABC transporter permease subunit [Sporosarcina sp. BI001-red]